LAIILRDRAALFLDGRYLLQGREEARTTEIDVESISPASRREWLKRFSTQDFRLGLDPWLFSMPDLSDWRCMATDLGFGIELLLQNPIDDLWLDGRPEPHRPRIVDYSVQYAGQTFEAKCAALVEHVRAAGLEAFLVADPEDVSWLLNVRAADEALKTQVGESPVVPSSRSRVLVGRNGKIVWFVDEHRLNPEILARPSDAVVIKTPPTLEQDLRDAARRGPVGTDLRRTPAALTAIIEEWGNAYADDTVSRWRWRKNTVELESARRAHLLDSAAVVRFMSWLVHSVTERTITEFEAAQALENFRSQSPAYKGASMPLCSASGPSGAQPHYNPPPTGSRTLNDHPIYWMDSGGHYLGGTTDNTITLALGTPDTRHVHAHTLVLQGFIALATAIFPTGTRALCLDTIARQPLWHEGMDYAHGTGHGVGNYLNIHEGPGLSRDLTPKSTVPMEAGMIVTNEPGYYATGDFGLRVESHMVAVASRYENFLEFETISRLPIDPHLVDFARLSVSERQWLSTYHRTVLKDLEPLLDEPSVTWLRAVVEKFVRDRSEDSPLAPCFQNVR
jgi:Xaa-Pro aminopeptidase